MSDTAIVELTLGVTGILVTILSAAIGSYIATRSSINDLKSEFSALATQLAGFRDWLEKVSDGDTASVAEIRANLSAHEKRLDGHDERIGGLERFTAVLGGRMKDEG